MPLQSKRSRAAKRAHQNARAALATPASPEGSDSEYLGSDDSEIDVESGEESDIREGNGVKSSVEAIQQLYSVFLLSRFRLEEKGREKCQRTANRKAMYRGDSRMTAWRKNTALKRAAEGCKTLDAFVVRKVRLLGVKQYQRRGAHSF